MLTRRSTIILTLCLLLLIVGAGQSQIDRAQVASVTDRAGEQARNLQKVAASAANNPHANEVEHLPLASTQVEPLLLLLLGSTLLAIATGIKMLLPRKPINVDR